MNTIFNNMLVQATVQDMMERAAEARANRKAQKSGRNFGLVLLTATLTGLGILWALVAG